MKIQHEGEQAGGASVGMMKRFGRAMRGPAAVLRAVAGVPAGVARTRRGTFMVVVIGTLALLAVIAIAHFAVSQSDRRASASLARASKVDEVPDQIAKYLQGVIVIDRFVNVPEEVSDLLGSSNTDRQRFIARRESVDRPSTDWRTLSTDDRLTIDSNGLKMPNRQYFTPEGVGSDPWLADIAPQWLNWAGQDPAGGSPYRTEYQYRRDWGKISNFSPDGRFVSLVNLRNNFAAESGFGNDASGKPRTSEGLSLLTWNPANVGQRATRILATDFGLAVPQNSVASRRPAVWDSRQRGAYRAAKEWSSLLPSDIGYLDNEWVDTDGDGFVDARWAELVDARLLVDQFGNSILKNALVTDGKMRWFYAARAIDLSGLINVNTATDLRHEPGMAYPIGLTPADIDLKRLLTLSDAYEQWGVGYDSILQPIGAQNSSKASNYRFYDKTNAFDMGLGAYNSIRWSIDSVLVQDRYANSAWNWSGAGYNGKEGGLRHASWRAGASSTTGASFAGGQVTLPAFFPNTDMGELLGRFGVNNPDETSRLEAATGGRVPNAGGGGIPRRQFAYDPLRSNRDEAIEGNKTGSVNPAGVLTEQGQATAEAMLQSAIDLRSQVTTISASNEIPSMVGNDQTNYPYSSWATQIIANKDTKVQLAKVAATGTKPDSGSLFRAYARALAPAIKLPGAWPTGGVLPNGGGNAFLSRKTLFYGHRGPETALAVAGAMAVNAEAMFSTDGTINEPRTLVFDADLALLASDNPRSVPQSAARLPMVPWLRGNMSYCLDPQESDERVLATSAGGKQLQTPALHLYGFEPQVFITEVGCYTAWRDTPLANGGDNDRRPVVLGQPNGFITIDGDLDESNADFMFRCVAIQLHNPFDEDVVVSTGFPVPAGARIDGAREFSYVKIKQHDQSGSAWANVGLFTTQFVAGDQISVNGLTVAAGETVVCYVFNKNPISVARRLADQGVVADAEAGKAFLRDWAEKQFSEAGSLENVSKRAVMVVGVDDAISNVITDAAANSKMIEDPTGTLGMTVQLWKSRRANMTEYGGPDEVGAGANPNNPNLTGNDQLVDRFRLPPNTVTLDARIKSGNNDVDNCFGGNPAGPFGPLNHNSGITIARWTTASRPSDPMDGGAAGTDIPRGGLPAYCIEPKVWRAGPGGNWHKSFNEDPSQAPNAPLTVTKDVIDQLIGANKVAEYTASAWTSNGRSTTYSGTITKSPRNKRTAPSAVPAIQANLDGVEYKLVRDLLPKSARGDKGFGGVNPTFGTDVPGTPSKASTLRVADMLLPMAICPWESPMQPDFNEQTDPNIRFLTAAEAFAVAYGYEIIPAPSAQVNKADPLSLYFKAPDGTNPDGNFGNRERPVMVNGHVVLDDFVPFYDGNRDGLFNRDNAYNGIVGGASPADKDIRFGLGIPAALGVMDQFSAFGEYEGSPIRPVSGLININTAPANVMRMLPLVTPADAAWGTDLIWSNGWSQTKESTDLAASIVAYRDKNRTYKLPRREIAELPARFTGDQAAGRPPVTAAGGNATEGTERQIGRAQASQIDAIREETGFLSTGELMCVLERRANDQGGTGTQRDKKKSLDFLGFNNQTRTVGGDNNDRKGINSQLFKGTGATLDVDEVKNDFAERLQIMAALSNVTTVRSDVFAVWFVVRGYAQEDTENLGPDDPMTPSVERRFVMVIDRSGVSDLRGANQARVVLFKEVPR